MTLTVQRPAVQHLAGYLVGQRPAVRGRGYAAPASTLNAPETLPDWS